MSITVPFHVSDSGQVFAYGHHLVTYLALDNDNNSALCKFQVFVNSKLYFIYIFQVIFEPMKLKDRLD